LAAATPHSKKWAQCVSIASNATKTMPTSLGIHYHLFQLNMSLFKDIFKVSAITFRGQNQEEMTNSPSEMTMTHQPDPEMKEIGGQKERSPLPIEGRNPGPFVTPPAQADTTADHHNGNLGALDSSNVMSPTRKKMIQWEMPHSRDTYSGDGSPDDSGFR
jgi:hypothetical protein